MSDAPKGGKQAPKVANKGEKHAGKKGDKIGGSSEKKPSEEERKAMLFTSTTFSDRTTQMLEFQAKQCLS